MTRKILTLLIAGLLSNLQAQTITFPIKNGVLQNALNANSQPIDKLSRITIGTIVPGTLHAINVTGTGNTAVEGIQFGGDTELYRSAAGRLTIDGDLLVTGAVFDSGGTPIRLTGTNVWSGLNTFNGTTNLTGGGTVGGTGLSFTAGAPVTNTRQSLGLQPGINILAYSLRLQNIADLTPTNNAFLIANGTTWTAVTGAPARTAIGLGVSSTPTFTDLTLTGNLTAVAGTLSGVLSLTGATNLPGAAIIGDTALYGTGGVLTTNGGLSIGGSTVLGDGAGDTVRIPGTLYLGATGLTDAPLTRSGANTITTPAILVAGELRPTAALSTTYGGTGLNLGATPASNMLYTSATGTFATTTLTEVSRNFLALSSATAWRSGLELGTAAITNTGTGNTNTILGNDARLSDTRVPSGAAGGSLADTYPNPTLSLTGVAAASYGSTTTVPSIAINAEGRITSASNVTISGVAPSGSIASGSLAGSSYPNPTVANNAIQLGPQTVGNYVQSIVAGSGITLTAPGEGVDTTVSVANDGVTLGTQTAGNYVKSVVAGTGITVTTAGEGVDTTVSLPQAIDTAATPTFGALTVTNTATVGKLAGVLHAKRIIVDPASALLGVATDTRTSLDKYDRGVPFATLAAAYAVAATGDTIVLRKAATSYGARTLSTTGVDICLEDGAVLGAVSIDNLQATIFGSGSISTASTAITAANAANLTVYVPVTTTAATGVLATGSATVTLLAPVTASNADVGTLAISMASGTTVNLDAGARLTSGGTYTAGAAGSLVIRGVASGNKPLNIALAAGGYIPDATNLTANSKAARPWDITAGGTGGTTQSTAKAGLGIQDLSYWTTARTAPGPGTTTTLTIASTRVQQVAPASGTATFVLPSEGMVNGDAFTFQNIGPGSLLVNAAGLNIEFDNITSVTSVRVPYTTTSGGAWTFVYDLQDTTWRRVWPAREALKTVVTAATPIPAANPTGAALGTANLGTPIAGNMSSSSDMVLLSLPANSINTGDVFEYTLYGSVTSTSAPAFTPGFRIAYSGGTTNSQSAVLLTSATPATTLQPWLLTGTVHVLSDNFVKVMTTFTFEHSTTTSTTATRKISDPLVMPINAASNMDWSIYVGTTNVTSHTLHGGYIRRLGR